MLHRRGEDEGQASSYTVQILVSPGVSLSEVEASSPSGRGSVPQVHTEPLLISSRPDLSLEDVDLFLDSLGCNEPHDDGSGAHPPPTPPAPDRAASHAPRRSTIEPGGGRDETFTDSSLGAAHGSLATNGDAATAAEPPSPPRAAALATEGECTSAGAAAGAAAAAVALAALALAAAAGANGAAGGATKEEVPAAAGCEAAPPPLSADGATPDPTPGCVNPCSLA